MSEDKNYISLEYLDSQEYLIVTTLVKLNETRKQNATLKAQLEHILKLSEGRKAEKKEYPNESEGKQLSGNPPEGRIKASEDVR